MKLFDYIKVLFGRDPQWEKLKGYDKSKNSFMTNRFMSIKFPIQANMFNALKIDPVGQAGSNISDEEKQKIFKAVNEVEEKIAKLKLSVK